MKKTIKNSIIFLVVSNTFIFLLLAVTHQLPTDSKALVFIDFWGRLTVYSLWAIGYAVYRMYIVNYAWLKRIIIFLVCLNIPLFLLLAYFDKINNDPENLAMIDFWGRITVYSLWFMGYEAYRERLSPTIKDRDLL